MDKLESIYFKDNEEIVKDVSIFREKNTWINLTDPADEDIAAIQEAFDIPVEHLKAALERRRKISFGNRWRYPPYNYRCSYP